MHLFSPAGKYQLVRALQSPRAVRIDMFNLGLTQTQLPLHAFRQVTQCPISVSQHHHPYTSLAFCYRHNKPTCFRIFYVSQPPLAREQLDCSNMCQTPAQTSPFREHSTQLQLSAKPPSLALPWPHIQRMHLESRYLKRNEFPVKSVC